MRILVKRTGAFGDVLETTPIIARLRRENPEADIDVDTQYPGVFDGHPNITSTKPSGEYDRTIILDMAFENLLRKVHPVDAYSEVAFGDRKTRHTLHMRWGTFDKSLLHPRTNWAKAVVIHPCRNWPIRTLSLAWWQELVNILNKRGYEIIVTGTSQDHDGLTNVIDLRDKLRPQQQVGLIDASCCFVCSESGPMILAQVTATPIIAMLTMAPAFAVKHERKGGYAWRFDAVMADIPCAGCSATFDKPTTYFGCKYGHGNCVKSFDVKKIAALVEERAV